MMKISISVKTWKIQNELTIKIIMVLYFKEWVSIFLDVFKQLVLVLASSIFHILVALFSLYFKTFKKNFNLT